MTITPEQLAAFADGELSEADAHAVAALVAQDPDMARTVAEHRALRERLSAHFTPILSGSLPDRLTAPLAKPEAQVIDFAKVREQRANQQPVTQQKGQRRSTLRWAWIAAPALAASLVLAVVLPNRDGRETALINGQAYAAGPLASALDSELSAVQPASAQTRILLSFKDSAGTYCRGFSGKAQAGIACRDGQGWQLRKVIGGSDGKTSDYRQAGSDDAALMALAQDMAPDGALDAAQEQAAKARGWH